MEAPMHDHPDETLRGKDHTADGRHLHEPDGFPHSMIGVLAFFLFIFPIIVGAFWAGAGIGGALIAAGLLLFVGVPLVVSKLRHGAQEWRAVEATEEHEVEQAEAAGTPPPENSIERVNDRWNRSPYDETVPRTVPPR
jgi:hypothetical protein